MEIITELSMLTKTKESFILVMVVIHIEIVIHLMLIKEKTVNLIENYWKILRKMKI